MAPRRRKRTSVTPEQEATIREQVTLGWSAAEIHREIAPDGIPSLRTVQEIAKQARVSDASSNWTVLSSDPEGARLVLPVLSVLNRRSGGRRSLTDAEARWVVRVRRMAPDLPPYSAYQLASFYLHRGQRGLPTDDVDALLAYAPWRGPQAWAQYKGDVAAGWIRQPALPWVFARRYRDMLDRMGFDRFLLDEANDDEGYIDYQRLVSLQAELDTKGKAGPIKRLISMPEDLVIEKVKEGKHD